MPAGASVLVIGAGPAGAATATLLAEGGIAVDLVDAKPEVTVLGSGITLQGNALRVLRELQVWDEVQSQGYSFQTIGLRAPDADGTLLMEIDDARTGGPDLPATLGMERPRLASILIERAVAAGARLRLGTKPTGLDQDDCGVDVTFADGSAGRYDLVVGADGVHSWTRRTIGIETEPAPTGMGIWRAFGPRPDSVTRTDLSYGGAAYIAGYCPTGDDSLYAYVVEGDLDRSSLSPEGGLQTMRELVSGYHGPWDEIRDSLTDPAKVNHTSFESHIVEAPWNRGRIVIIGDAAHSCPPTLAQGCAQALEDASVLAEVLLAADQLDEEVWREFHERRVDRARAVVEASLQLGQWLLDHEEGDVPGLMGRVAKLLSEPA